MANLPSQADQHSTTGMRDLKWSPAEKAIARGAYDLALRRALDAVIRETKDRAARIEQPVDLWNLEEYLGERRREIDRTFDYRYSALPLVFAMLVHQGHIHEKDLDGLGEDKLAFVRARSAGGP